MIQKTNVNSNEPIAKKAVLAIVFFVIFTLLFLGQANSTLSSEDTQKASLTLLGQGAKPNSVVTLSTGPTQKIQVKADKDGNFAFSNMQYVAFEDLKFNLSLNAFNREIGTDFPQTNLDFLLDPRGSTARVTGNIGKGGSLSFNLGGVSDGSFTLAGNDGYVLLQNRTPRKISSGSASLVTTIVNSAELCCPRTIVPAMPITLSLKTQPIAVPKPVVTTNPVVPTNAKPANKIPFIHSPQNKPTQDKPKTPDGQPSDSPANQPKKKIPYIIQGSIEFQSEASWVEGAFAASFSASDYDATWVGGLKKWTNEIRNGVYLRVAALGAFLDAQSFNDTLRALQISTVRTLVNYTPSDAVCRFGTLTKSASSADAIADKNHLAFSKILFERDSQKVGTLYADPVKGIITLSDNFRSKYCDKKTNNGFLDAFCAASLTDADFNRDVDFTRVFDNPLTLDADFTVDGITKDKHSVLALFDNLTMIEPLMSRDDNYFDLSTNTRASQDLRTLHGLRTVTSNSFGALVGEKVKSTAASSTHMHKMLEQLGLSNPDAKKLVGDNPSYFAQMEVLSKKIYQDPAFYANLYESGANVDRQRVAMKAIELQQERDFLESLRRREMLLSVLLNARLAEPAGRADQSGYINLVD
jgi:hypothetical protein